MSSNTDAKSNGLWWKAGLLLVVLGAAAYYALRPAETKNQGLAYTVKRSPLKITVVENGTLEAQESLEIRSEIKGWQGTKLLSIIEEGYAVTDEDVRTNKVLVELDPSELRKTAMTTDIDFQSKQAGLTEAQQAHEIQLAQNRSDIKSAVQKARFARLDVEKYLGDKVAEEICKRLGLDQKLEELGKQNGIDQAMSEVEQPPPSAPSGAVSPDPAAAMPAGAAVVAFPAGAQVTTTVALTAAPGSPGGSSPVPQQPSTASPAPTVKAAPKADPEPPAIIIDYSEYAKVELLGDGEAQQKLRENTDSLLLAEKEKSASKAKLDGTERLFAKEFVTKTEVDTSRLEYEQVDLKVKKAATALTLFMKYEFPKAAEELVSKYEEAVRMLEKTRKEAGSKLAQMRARMKSAEQQYRIVDDQRKDLNDQIGKCTIRATKPGLVIYGGTGDGMYWSGEERIREGAVIRERQPIITIPNMTKMSVKVKIHEAQIKKVKKGMLATIRVDAHPDKILTGEVTKVGVLPDSQNRWMNPDLKVYLTTLDVKGTNDWLKPGMSAKVEILVSELKDVLSVPMQAVSPSGNEQVCYLRKNGGEPQRVVVVSGDYSDEFIEIKSGLKDGDVVLLRSPEGSKAEDGQKPEEKAKEKPAAAAAAPSATATDARPK